MVETLLWILLESRVRLVVESTLRPSITRNAGTRHFHKQTCSICYISFYSHTFFSHISFTYPQQYLPHNHLEFFLYNKEIELMCMKNDVGPTKIQFLQLVSRLLPHVLVRPPPSPTYMKPVGQALLFTSWALALEKTLRLI